MRVVSVKELASYIKKLVVNPKSGEEEEKTIKVKLGTKMILDNGMSVNYNRKRGTYSVTYPAVVQLNRAGLPMLDGRGEEVYGKPTKFNSITEGRLVKEFSPQFVQLIKENLHESAV
jgi:hypothetical protein